MGEEICIIEAANNAHRYWRIVKTNGAASGPYVTEWEMYVGGTGGTKVSLTAGMFTNSGFADFSASALLNGTLSESAGFTSNVAAGASITIDLGAGNAKSIDTLRVYNDLAVGNIVADIEYSDNGSDWTNAGTLDTTSTDSDWTEAAVTP